MRKSDIGLIITICLMPITLYVVLTDYYQEQEDELKTRLLENIDSIRPSDVSCEDLKKGIETAGFDDIKEALEKKHREFDC